MPSKIEKWSSVYELLSKKYIVKTKKNAKL